MYFFPEVLIHGILVKRYKRFLAEVLLDDGKVVTAHCTNSGSMKNCLENGAEVYLSKAKDPERKTQYTWEMIRINGLWVGINTMIPNLIAYQWIKAEMIPGLEGYDLIQREVNFEDSRFDLFLSNAKEQCFVEVKNVTLREGKVAMFPDAVTTRGLKHLEGLIRAKGLGYRVVMLYIVQRMDVNSFAPASHIDPEYTNGFAKAMKSGVEVIPLRVEVSPQGIEISNVLGLK